MSVELFKIFFGKNYKCLLFEAGCMNYYRVAKKPGITWNLTIYAKQKPGIF